MTAAADLPPTQVR